jgi:hypothetical protein
MGRREQASREDVIGWEVYIGGNRCVRPDRVFTAGGLPGVDLSTAVPLGHKVHLFGREVRPSFVHGSPPAARRR